MRIAFVTSERPNILADDVDRPLHEATAARRGWELVHASWWDPTVDWTSYDLVVVRSVWDYADRTEEFLSWLDALSPAVRLHNPLAVLRWNLDKRYLLALAAAGVPVVATTVADDRTALVEALDVLADEPSPGDEVVIKPNISAGSRRTGRFAVGDRQAMALGEQILAGGSAVLVQPAVPSVATRGEVAVVCFGGEVSHAVAKGPMLASGGGLVGGAYHERLHRLALDDPRAAPAVALAVHTADTVAALTAIDRPLLYGRYDVVELADGSAALLEAELFEPAFFLPVAPEAAERFAAALARVVAP